MLPSQCGPRVTRLVASLAAIFALVVLTGKVNKAEVGNAGIDEKPTINSVRVVTVDVGRPQSVERSLDRSPTVGPASKGTASSGSDIQATQSIANGKADSKVEREKNSVEFDASDPGSFLQPDIAFAEYDTHDFFATLFKTTLVDPSNTWVVEAGSYNGKQLDPPLQQNFNVMVFEPSSKNFNRMMREIKKIYKRCRVGGCKGQLKTHQVAASGTRTTVEFLSTKHGGTGDHIALGGRIAQGEFTEQFTRNETVEAAPLDDYLVPVAQKDKIFALKIDVQDHEPAVLRGLTTTLSRGLVDFVLLEYRPQGWAHMFPDSRPEAELLKVCGQPHYRCYYTERETRNSQWQESQYPRFFPGWAATGPGGKGWSIPSFNKKMSELKQFDEFGTWTDIVAVNTNSTLAMDVLSDVLRRKCKASMFTATPPQCRPKE